MSWKVAALLLMVALPGVVATSWLAVPLLVDSAKIPVSLETLQVVTALQGAALVTAAALVGASLALRVGLAAPVMMALAIRGQVLEALRPQLVPGIVVGCLGALVILGFHAFAPAALDALQSETPLPLVVRVLYGGITEEVLVRWGLMTALVWAGRLVLRVDPLQPSPAIVWAAITLSALAFGASHVPSVAQSVPALSATIVAYITIGNALFGVIAGGLFWRYGLEAAMVAHVSAHLLAFLVRG